MQATTKQSERRDNTQMIAAIERQVEGVIFSTISENLKAIVHDAVHEGVIKVVEDSRMDAAPTPPVREERNGVVKPGKPGKCLQVWQELDRLVSRKKVPTLQMIQQIAAKKGWNTSNARVEFYRWKKFNG